ncbi:hypothetical protein EDB80DRAFT_318932 [Ilyonectria destructans]|nr:hypothetical protein EDB80DRAFT_318932 [Ilyonectria destructans]
MTQVDTWGMTGNIDSFRRGTTAFRNARDWAKQHRDNVIREANATASQARTAAAQADATGPHEDDIVTPHEPHELHEPVDPAQYITLQDADGPPAMPTRTSGSTRLALPRQTGTTRVSLVTAHPETDSSSKCASCMGGSN